MPTAEDIPALTDHLGYWMRLVSNHVSYGFARRLQGMDVTVAEWVMLRALYAREATSPSRLADRMGMTRGAVSKLADRLIDKGLLVRTENPQDGRAHTLALTEAGRRLTPELARLADENDAAFFGHLTPDDQTLLRKALEAVAEHHSLKDVPTS